MACYQDQAHRHRQKNQPPESSNCSRNNHSHASMSSLSTWSDTESNNIFTPEGAVIIRKLEQIMSNQKHSTKCKEKRLYT